MGVTSRAMGRSRMRADHHDPGHRRPGSGEAAGPRGGEGGDGVVTAVRAPARIGDTGRSWRGWVQPGPAGWSGWANRSATARQRSKAGSATSLARRSASTGSRLRARAPDSPAGEEAGCAGRDRPGGPARRRYRRRRRRRAGPTAYRRRRLPATGRLRSLAASSEAARSSTGKGTLRRSAPSGWRRADGAHEQGLVGGGIVGRLTRSTSDRRPARRPAARPAGGRPRRRPGEGVLRGERMASWSARYGSSSLQASAPCTSARAGEKSSSRLVSRPSPATS